MSSVSLYLQCAVAVVMSERRKRSVTALTMGVDPAHSPLREYHVSEHHVYEWMLSFEEGRDNLLTIC